MALAFIPMSATPRMVKLTVINDFICPNCCIGQHELLSALSHVQNVLHLNLAFEIEFLPFRLIPTSCLDDGMPKVDKVTFFTRKLGEANFKALSNAIEKWGEEKNIPLKFSGVMSQSTRAHRLSKKAYLLGGQRLQLPLTCALFKAHLEEGKDIADIGILSDIAEKVGMMSREEAKRFLVSDELERETNEAIDEAKQKGITGVPLTVINGKWAVEGGQSSEVFIQIFRKLETCTNSTPVFIPPPLETDIAAQPVQQLC